MNLDETLDRVRDELADEVASQVRVPSFDGVLARGARRRRRQATAGGVALVVVAAGVVGGVAATRPDASRSVPPAATLSVGPTPSASPQGPFTSAPHPPFNEQTYPAGGSSYVVVPDGDQLAWTDLKTGVHGHFGRAKAGTLLTEPSVSANGRRVAYLQSSTATSAGQNSIGYWDLDTHSGGVLATATSPLGVQGPTISPDGTRVVFVEFSSGIHIATISAAGPSRTVPTPGVPGVQIVTWNGDNALAYLPADADRGGNCAVERISLSTAARRCLLPTATLQALPAPNGTPWQVTNVRGASDTGLLSLVVTAQVANGPVTMAVAILDPSAAATPFHVLPSTVTMPLSSVLGFTSVLVDRGTRVVYSTRGTNAVSQILVAPVAGGSPATVPNAAGGSGLGATSG